MDDEDTRVKTDDDPSGASASSSYDPSMADEGAQYTLRFHQTRTGSSLALVGRAMWSPITCTFCFIAVISGLVITLLALGLYGRALPALPVSIALGVFAYFLSRFCLNPPRAVVRGELCARDHPRASCFARFRFQSCKLHSSIIESTRRSGEARSASVSLRPGDARERIKRPGVFIVPHTRASTSSRDTTR